MKNRRIEENEQKRTKKKRRKKKERKRKLAVTNKQPIDDSPARNISLELIVHASLVFIASAFKRC